MVPRVRSLMRFLIKGSVAGGAVYLVYDQELLGSSDKSQAVLQKAEEVVPNAVYQFSQDTPAPGVQRSLQRSGPWGSIGELATRRRGSGATAPSPAPATQDAASVQRPGGCGPRPDPAPGQPRRRRPTGSFRSLRPRHYRVGWDEEGEESEPSFPGRGARHPTPAPPPSPTTHSCARLTLSAPRGRDGGAHWAGGRVG
ncbi:hypothetical protein R6Z07F_011138 [Ovis aries]